MIALQSFYKSDRHRSVEERVFAIALFGSAPARVSSEDRVWRANDETALMILRALKNIAGFISFDRGSLSHEFRIPRRSKTDSLWKCRRRNNRRASPLSRTSL